MKKLFMIIVSVLSLQFSTYSWAIVMNFYPIHDAEIVYSPGNPHLNDTNFGDSMYLTNNSGQPGVPTMDLTSNSFGLLWFDLSSIPQGSTVNSASLRLFQGMSGGFTGISVDLFTITSEWDSATVTYNNRPDWDPADVSSLVIPDAFANTYRTWNITDITQEWINGTTANYGLITSDVHLNSSDYRYWIRFYSSDSPGTLYDPRLQINYSPGNTAVPEPGSLGLLSIGLVGLLGKFRKKRIK